MALIVQKFGGTSVATIERMRRIAQRVCRTKKEGNDIVVVLSAMAGETDRLISLAKEASDMPDAREYDVLVSTGEQVSVALLSMILKDMGVEARSFISHQMGLFTDSSHTRARIMKVETGKIKGALSNGAVVVAAGFQGISSDMDITTLGRGGSDTTAVALATALGADLCEIYTDVEGVYTTDPNICPDARKLKKISYDEMLEMASLGSKVLQTRSVELAKKYSIPVMVRSTFSENNGTLVTKEGKDMESVMVSGVTYDRNEAKISLTRVPDRPGIASRLFGPLAEANINVDMIIQNISHEGYTDMTFTISKEDFKKALDMVEESARDIGAEDVLADTDIAKISVVGTGMRSHSGVASKMFDALAKEGINVIMISTSEIKISCIIDSKYTELAVRVLHEAFELNKENGGTVKEP